MRLYRRSSASPMSRVTTAAFATVLCCSLFASMKSALAQNTTPHVSLTYLANPVDSPNHVREIVTKTVPVTDGVANVSINTDYIDDPSLENGSSFVVQPTIDPQITLQETLYNFSGKMFTNLSYTLPDGLYFSQDDLDNGLFSSTKFTSISLSDAFTFEDPNDTSNPANGSTVFKTVTFNPLTTKQTPLLNGQSANFTITFHTPTVIDDNSKYEITTLPTAITATPEPGSIALFATAFVPLALVRRRKRVA